MARLGMPASLALLALPLLGGCSIPGTEAGGPCNSQHVCLAGMTCDVESNTCVSPDQLAWEKMRTPYSTAVRAVWGLGPDDVYAVGGSTILHYGGNGLDWTEDTAAGLVGSASLYDVWGTGDELWVVGSINSTGSKVLYRKGAWSQQRIVDSTGKDYQSVTLNAVTGTSSPRAVWAVGGTSSDYLVFRLQGSTWLADTSAALKFEGEDITSAGQALFVVGSAQQVKVFNGSWATTNLDQSQALRAVWGGSSDNVWAVGPTQTLLHYDGSAWETRTVANLPASSGIWGTDAGDFYIVGQSGGYYNDYSAVHHCTTTGSCTPAPVTADKSSAPSFHGVWCSGDGSTVVVVGENGAIYRRRK